MNILITFTFSLLSLISFSQEKHLSGPKAKNCKTWISQNLKTRILLKNHDHKLATGPSAKNNNRWADDCKIVQFVPQKRKIVQGPEAKNWATK